MRLVAFVGVLALAACGQGTAKGPAWPEMAERDEDGGESLAPRGGTAVEASPDEPKSEDTDAKAETSEPASSAAASDAEPVVTPSATASEPVITIEETITADEIVIEIED